MTTRTGKPGFRVLEGPPALDAASVDRFRGMAAANLADAMGRFNFMDPGIRSRTRLPMCGVAVTVLCRPADNLLVHKALQVAERGQIVVVNTCGNTTSAVFGELMCTTAAAKGIGGIIVDGAIRDVDGIQKLGMPAFSRTVCPGGCDKDGPGEINVPIACGGTVVMPGDIIVGDEEGVAVIPRDQADDVHRLVGELMARETARIAEIKAGGLYKAEIDDALRKKGIID
jgi:regulator of RNase E activity RraA